jgi:iron complex outermembrane receptor protein
MPITKKLELTSSIRYDQIGDISDNLSGKTVGHTENATTWKVSAKCAAAKNLMLRAAAAAGTGFRAASMQEIAGPKEDFGVTGGNYKCPLTAANGTANHPLAAYCNGVGRQQFEAFQSGNPDLKPEKSKQWSMGLRVRADGQPVDVLRPVERANPKVENRGIDYDFTHKMKLFDGKLTSRLSGTYLLRSRYTTPGTDDQWETSLNRYGSNDKVSFKNVIRATSSFETAKWTHTLAANYRNGDTDKPQSEDDCSVIVAGQPGACYGITLDVPSYTTFDLQTAYRPMKNVELTGSIINLFDHNPPFTLRNTGSHQIGYNPSYSSTLGRQFYVSGSYKF